MGDIDSDDPHEAQLNQNLQDMIDEMDNSPEGHLDHRIRYALQNVPAPQSSDFSRVRSSKRVSIYILTFFIMAFNVI